MFTRDPPGEENKGVAALLLRKMVVMDVKRAVLSGQISPVNLNNKVDEWCEKMAMSGTYVDHTWFEMAAQMLDSDVVIVPLHAFPGNPCHIISAGLLGHDGYGRDVRHGKNVPIFIGKYCSMTCLKLLIVHFQVTLKKKSILMDIFSQLYHTETLSFSNCFVIREVLMLLRSLSCPHIQVSTLLYLSFTFIILSV